MKVFVQKIRDKFFTREIISYGVVGVLTTLLNLWLTHILYDGFKLDENTVTIIAWVSSVTFSYILNAIVVFQDYFSDFITEIKKIGKFYISRIFTYVFEAVGIYIFITRLGLNFWVVKLSLTVIVVILNYVLAKFIVFCKKGKCNE